MPITWYVNLDPDPRNHRGPEIPLKVTRSFVTSYKANRSVRWTCTPGPNNLNTVAADASWTQGTAPNTQNSTVSEQNRTREFHNRLQLPPYGDETYSVTAKRSDKTSNSLNKQFEIKRRLYYVVNWMNNEGQQLFAVVKPILERIFREVGIELEKVGGSAIPDRTDVTDLRPLVENRPAIPRSKHGLCMRLALIRMASFEVYETTTLPLVHGHGTGVAGADTVEDDNGTWQLTVHLPPEPNLADFRKLRFAMEPEVTVKLGEYYHFSSEVRREWFDSDTNIPCDVVRVDNRTARIRIRDAEKQNNANLTRLLGIYRDAKLTGTYASDYFSSTPRGLQLSLEVQMEGLRPLGGFSSGPNIALTQDVSVYYPHGTRQQRGQALARVFAHEIAHSIGMVMRTHTYNGVAQQHQNWYNGTHGGVGNHCHRNATLVNNTPLAAGNFYFPDNPNCHQVYTPNDGNICIMFHQRTNHLHGLEFCADCQEFMRAQDVSRGNLNRWDQVY